MSYLAGIVTTIALSGILGAHKAFHSYFLQNEPMNTPLSVGLLLARVYAISDHKRIILALLGVLGCCAIVPILVCCMFFCPAVSVLDGHYR